MPNYKLSSPVRNHIRDRANALAQRSLDYALADFPLTTMQIQYAVLDEATVNTMRRLIQQFEIRTIERHNQVRVTFLRSVLPELRQGVVVVLQLPEWIVVRRGTLWRLGSYTFDPQDHHYLSPDLTRLDAGDRERLVTWLARVTRQQRLFQITTHTVQSIIDDDRLTPTVAHLHALWPMLCGLVDVVDPAPDTKAHRKRRRAAQHTDWRDRMRNPPARLKPYLPAPDVREKFATLIRASDVMLTAGSVLQPYVHEQGIIKATVEHVEYLEGDWKPEE